jgi:hypothetical protein
MLQTHRFVGMFAIMQLPSQLVPEDPFSEKIVTIFKLRMYLTSPILRMFN